MKSYNDLYINIENIEDKINNHLETKLEKRELYSKNTHLNMILHEVIREIKNGEKPTISFINMVVLNNYLKNNMNILAEEDKQNTFKTLICYYLFNENSVILEKNLVKFFYSNNFSIQEIEKYNSKKINKLKKTRYYKVLYFILNNYEKLKISEDDLYLYLNNNIDEVIDTLLVCKKIIFSNNIDDIKKYAGTYNVLLENTFLFNNNKLNYLIRDTYFKIIEDINRQREEFNYINIFNIPSSNKHLYFVDDSYKQKTNIGENLEINEILEYTYYFTNRLLERKEGKITYNLGVFLELIKTNNIINEGDYTSGIEMLFIYDLYNQFFDKLKTIKFDFSVYKEKDVLEEELNELKKADSMRMKIKCMVEFTQYLFNANQNKNKSYTEVFLDNNSNFDYINIKNIPKELSIFLNNIYSKKSVSKENIELNLRNKYAHSILYEVTLNQALISFIGLCITIKIFNFTIYDFENN